MKTSFKISLLIIVILFSFSLIILNDYSKYKQDNPDEFHGAVVLSDGDLSINYSSGDHFYLKDMENGYTYEKKFSVTNTGTSTQYYSISLNDIDYSIDSDGELTFSLISNNEGANVSNIAFPKDAQEITSLVTIAPDVTQTYTIVIKYTGSIDSDEYVKGMISVKSKNNEQSFSSVILANNQIKEAKTKIGKEIATTNEGLIASTDDEGITYYFRGNVKNNYVKFASKTWRIVRINGDSSIRLILNDAIDGEYAYNTNELSDNKYENLTDFSKSTLKSILEDWYDKNINQHAKYVVNSEFCIDGNISREETDKYYRSYIRIMEDENPLYNCIGTPFSTNIGLLSVDEAIFAGAYNDVENKESYLYNPNITENWWLNNPYSITKENSVKMFTFDASNGKISQSEDILVKKAVRPVINIRNSINVTGTGTEEDPYVIE